MGSPNCTKTACVGKRLYENRCLLRIRFHKPTFNDMSYVVVRFKKNVQKKEPKETTPDKRTIDFNIRF